MKAEIKPTGKIDRLKENLERRVESIKKKDGKLLVELEKPELLERTPGIESFQIDGEETEGLEGSPVEEQVYAKIESKRDAVKALLATIKGYDLRILNTSNDWDLRQLKKYNPDIKHLKFDFPKEFLDIEKSISDVEGKEKIEIEMPETEEEVKEIYQEMLT